MTPQAARCGAGGAVGAPVTELVEPVGRERRVGSLDRQRLADMRVGATGVRLLARARGFAIRDPDRWGFGIGLHHGSVQRRLTRSSLQAAAETREAERAGQFSGTPRL